MSKGKELTFIAVGIICFLIGGIFGYLISNSNEENVEEISISPIATIQFNVNVNDQINNQKSYLSEKISDVFFLKDDIIRFYGQDSIDPDGAILDYEWTFTGDIPELDEIHEKGRTIERTFYNIGSYSISLAVIDNDGLMNITSIQFEVVERPSLYLVQDGAWLEVIDTNPIDDHPYQNHQVEKSNLILWYDTTYSTVDDFLPNGNGFQDTEVRIDDFDNGIDGDPDYLEGFISEGDMIYLEELNYYPISKITYCVSVYFDPYSVDHFGLPSRISHRFINTTLVKEELLSER
jgi:hypothetical protein